MTKASKIPFPGFVLAVLDSSQFDNVEFKGDDRFDYPQSGILIEVTEDDQDKAFNAKGDTYGSLIGKKVSWAKYAEADAMFPSPEGDIVVIALDKLRAYEG